MKQQRWTETWRRVHYTADELREPRHHARGEGGKGWGVLIETSSPAARRIVEREQAFRDAMSARRPGGRRTRVVDVPSEVTSPARRIPAPKAPEVDVAATARDMAEELERRLS